MELLQAWEALLEGECVETDSGAIYKVENHKLLILITSGHWVDADGTNLTPSNAPFRIVKDPALPEPKPLTFDEAIQSIKSGKPLQVQEPWEVAPRRVDSNRNGIKRHTITYLAVAEMNGWPITEVTE